MTACQPGLRPTGGGRAYSADAGFVPAGLRRPGAGLVDVWAQADPASRERGCAGASAAVAVPCAAQRPLHRPALCADDSYGWPGGWRCLAELAGAMGLERYSAGAVSALTKGLGWVDFSLDRWVVNKGFDEGCDGVADGGRLLARLQDGRIQNYLRLLAAAVAALALYLLLGHRG